jgi:glucosamine-6-phosphate deaminase
MAKLLEANIADQNFARITIDAGRTAAVEALGAIRPEAPFCSGGFSCGEPLDWRKWSVGMWTQNMPENVTRFVVGKLAVRVFPTKQALGAAAAQDAVSIVRDAVARKGRARIIVATGSSQLDFVQSLVAIPGVPWHAVEVFHLDAYIGLPASHPASFRLWLRTCFQEIAKPAVVHYLAGDAADTDQECARYAALLTSAPIDVCFLGIGENGHIAFNDPHVADFADPLAVKRVRLDRPCRMQQVGEGHFARFEDVPEEALTLTCSALLGCEHLVCSVPEKRKAKAVKRALEGPVTTECPGSILRTHPQACVYLDPDSASLLSPETRRRQAAG